MRLEPQALECQCPEVAVAVLTTAPLALELATQAMEVTSFDASQRWWNIYPDRTSRMRNGPKGSEAVDSTLSRASANNNVSAHTKRPTETDAVSGGWKHQQWSQRWSDQHRQRHKCQCHHEPSQRG